MQISTENALKFLLQTMVSAESALPPEVAAWLTDGINQHLTDGVPLDQALGLVGGSRTAGYQYRMQQRDRHLKAAAELLADGSCPPWRRAQELKKAINRFEGAIWPRLRHHNQPPENLSELRRALFWARKLNMAPLPSSQRGLYEMLKPSLCSSRTSAGG